MNIHDMTIRAIRETRPLAARIERRDRGLAKQLREAVTSAALNASEGEHGRKGHRPEKLSVAMNSAKEARTALRAAAAWGYIGATESAVAEDALDHVAATLWRMIHA